MAISTRAKGTLFPDEASAIAALGQDTVTTLGGYPIQAEGTTPGQEGSYAGGFWVPSMSESYATPAQRYGLPTGQNFDEYDPYNMYPRGGLTPEQLSAGYSLWEGGPTITADTTLKDILGNYDYNNGVVGSSSLGISGETEAQRRARILAGQDAVTRNITNLTSQYDPVIQNLLRSAGQANFLNQGNRGTYDATQDINEYGSLANLTGWDTVSLLAKYPTLASFLPQIDQMKELQALQNALTQAETYKEDMPSAYVGYETPKEKGETWAKLGFGSFAAFLAALPALTAAGVLAPAGAAGATGAVEAGAAGLGSLAPYVAPTTAEGITWSSTLPVLGKAGVAGSLGSLAPYVAPTSAEGIKWTSSLPALGKAGAVGGAAAGLSGGGGGGGDTFDTAATTTSSLLSSLFGGNGSSGLLGGNGNLLNTLLGGGLIAAGAANDEQGWVEEARQYLRNQFTSPADPFAEGGVYEQYLPALQKQEQELLDQYQSRVGAGTPASLSSSISGPEIAGLSSLAEDMATNRQALQARLMESYLDDKINSAKTLLATDGSTLGDALGQIGSILTMSGLGLTGTNDSSSDFGDLLEKALFSSINASNDETSNGLLDIMDIIFGGLG